MQYSYTSKSHAFITEDFELIQKYRCIDAYTKFRKFKTVEDAQTFMQQNRIKINTETPYFIYGNSGEFNSIFVTIKFENNIPKIILDLSNVKGNIVPYAIDDFTMLNLGARKYLLIGKNPIPQIKITTYIKLMTTILEEYGLFSIIFDVLPTSVYAAAEIYDGTAVREIKAYRNMKNQMIGGVSYKLRNKQFIGTTK